MMMASLALGAFAPIFVERAAAQATLPSLQDVTRQTMTPNANWSQLTLPTAPPPPTFPTVNNTGTWTFGSGDATAIVNSPALNPQLGRIVNYSVSGSTTYASLNTTITGPSDPMGQRLATVTDTMTVTGLGLTGKGTGTPYFYCLYTPCSTQMVFKNYDDSTQTNGAQSPVSPVPWTGNATAFVQANQSLYGAQTVTLKMTTSIQNQAGTVSGYSVTGPYQGGVNRGLVP